jgi:hypothetical protein
MENDVSYQFVQPYLTAGEYILWRGKPDKGHLLSKSDIFGIPFSLVWCGGVFFAAFSSFRNGFGPESLFFIPFLLAGFYITVGRFLQVAWLRKHTYYVITNLKVVRMRNHKVDMLMGSNLPPVTVETYKNGNGTIRFSQPVQYTQKRNHIHIYGMEKGVFTLENIPDVARVQRYLTQISSQ